MRSSQNGGCEIKLRNWKRYVGSIPTADSKNKNQTPERHLPQHTLNQARQMFADQLPAYLTVITRKLEMKTPESFDFKTENKQRNFRHTPGHAFLCCFWAPAPTPSSNYSPARQKISCRTSINKKGSECGRKYAIPPGQGSVKLKQRKKGRKLTSSNFVSGRRFIPAINSLNESDKFSGVCGLFDAPSSNAFSYIRTRSFVSFNSV